MRQARLASLNCLWSRRHDESRQQTRQCWKDRANCKDTVLFGFESPVVLQSPGQSPGSSPQRVPEALSILNSGMILPFDIIPRVRQDDSDCGKESPPLKKII